MVNLTQVNNLNQVNNLDLVDKEGSAMIHSNILLLREFDIENLTFMVRPKLLEIYRQSLVKIALG